MGTGKRATGPEDSKRRAEEVLGQLHRQLGFQQLADLMDEIDAAKSVAKALATILNGLAEYEEKTLLGHETFYFLGDCIRELMKKVQAVAQRFHEEWGALTTTNVAYEASWVLDAGGPAAFLARFESLVRNGEDQHRSLEQIAREHKQRINERINAAAPVQDRQRRRR